MVSTSELITNLVRWLQCIISSMFETLCFLWTWLTGVNNSKTKQQNFRWKVPKN